VNFLKLNSGDWVSSRVEIGGNFIAHFTNLFTFSNSLIGNEMLDMFSSIISEEENDLLCTPPMEKEILEAFASLGTIKALDQMVLQPFFFKKYWHLVKKDVLICI
jgi:hypothetical protein